MTSRKFAERVNSGFTINVQITGLFAGFRFFKHRHRRTRLTEHNAGGHWLQAPGDLQIGGGRHGLIAATFDDQAFAGICVNVEDGQFFRKANSANCSGKP
jgi:hypothetical protein